MARFGSRAKRQNPVVLLALVCLVGYQEPFLKIVPAQEAPRPTTTPPRSPRPEPATTPSPPKKVSISREPQTRHYEVTVGIRLISRAEGKRYTAATVMPRDWPEQKLELLDKEIARCTPKMQELSGGTVVQITTSPLRRGQEAHAIYHYRAAITTRPRLVTARDFAARATLEQPEVKHCLKPSPGIQSDDREIKKLAQELAANFTADWDKAKAFYDWTFDNVQHVGEMPFTSAKEALDTRVGDCEEKASLFIALCRAEGIPARTVWVPQHCFAEFYLTDLQGKGHWIPAHTAGDRWFAELHTTALILQKGDNFREPGRGSKPKRLLNSWYRGTEPQPQVEFIQEVRPLESVNPKKK